ncbi:hypothetical protein MMM97_004403, partial [Salmonella enterica subsp. enterica serovar Bareilly]|nr:hypothetical protein [Salmonella enterica subsp. enterica serovar Bareilly]
CCPVCRAHLRLPAAWRHPVVRPDSDRQLLAHLPVSAEPAGAVSGCRYGPMRENPWLAATVPVAPPLSRRGLRSWHPGKRPPGCKGQRRFANRASRRCGGSLPVVLSGAIHLFKPLSPGAKTATTVSASPGVKCTSRKTFCPEAGKNFCGLPPDSRFRPWQ